jgi:hypothetical protein
MKKNLFEKMLGVGKIHYSKTKSEEYDTDFI